ncbi:acyltransferase [Gillisia limnaea]|uniref:Acyl-protein synthetase LuxE n=1 Tax=Gillisia limnaea (strain DSM 15749 / LMG 21470 / R-8282) TaxID=865937 RepID=H2BX96_GILLR|nr:acyltransferase [Gillisia limnaea]EHQ03086.1 acyl-protein synthetase LuxE [Gillisia limnaea DSM 15749]
MDYSNIFSIASEAEFRSVSLEVFRFQFSNNPVYRRFCELLQIQPKTVDKIQKIPFIPIDFFKSERLLSSTAPVEKIFTSSGTTGKNISKHYVTDLGLYERSFTKAFSHVYGNIKDYAVLALLPSYLERKGSSLIYMADDLIRKSQHPKSGFYLNNLSDLKKTLISLDNSGQKVLLIGVSFALLDLVEKYKFELQNTIIMETGGMKGRRKEMIRTELHELLKKGFGVSHIHSEYGMTELLSQAYSKGNGSFECPAWMKILIRDPEDALTYLPEGKTGGINVIDLANINSCSFIATQDLGKINADGSIEILGRFDNSDIRGCNLMVL